MMVETGTWELSWEWPETTNEKCIKNVEPEFGQWQMENQHTEFSQMETAQKELIVGNWKFEKWKLNLDLEPPLGSWQFGKRQLGKMILGKIANGNNSKE